MSYPSLIRQTHHAQPRSEEFLDQIVLFDVERGAAEVGDAGGVFRFVVEGSLARFPQSLRDELHRLIERHVGPLTRSRRAITHRLRARVMRDQLVARGPFGTEMSARDRRLRIAFDGDDLAVAMKDELSASDAAVGTDRTRHFGLLVLRPQGACRVAHRIGAGAVASIAKLANERPLEQKLGEHGKSVCKALSLRKTSSQSRVVTSPATPRQCRSTRLRRHARDTPRHL